jgi:hypothetical protein
MQYKTHKYRKVRLNLDDQMALGEFIGLIAGDGGQSYYSKKGTYKVRLYLSSNQLSLLRHIMRLFRRLFSITPRVYNHQYRSRPYNMISVEVESKRIYEIITEHLSWNKAKRRSGTIHLNNRESYSRDFLCGFARGLIESDGWVLHNQIGLKSTSKLLAVNFYTIIREVGFNPKFLKRTDRRGNRSVIYLVAITGKQEVRNLIKLLNPIKN